MKKLIPLIVAVLFGCSDSNNPQVIIDKAIAAHGGNNFEKAVVSFTFRDRKYSAERYASESTYTREFSDSLGQIKDVLYNSTELVRFVNDTIVDLSPEWERRYGASVNSVLYFFQLSYGLNDTAVNKEFLGEVDVLGKPYFKIKVTFGEEGGGEDHEDVFIYWVHKENFMMDYLAYSYQTDGGGTRFRQAINRRTINGIVVQDYINFKAKEKELPIEKHDDYFVNGKLVELSRIINEDVKVY